VQFPSLPRKEISTFFCYTARRSAWRPELLYIALYYVYDIISLIEFFMAPFLLFDVAKGSRAGGTGPAVSSYIRCGPQLFVCVRFVVAECVLSQNLWVHIGGGDYAGLTMLSGSPFTQ
jgi:hypothetical protein